MDKYAAWVLCCSIQFFKVSLQIKTVTRTTENGDGGRETRNLQTEVKIELFDVESHVPKQTELLYSLPGLTWTVLTNNLSSGKWLSDKHSSLHSGIGTCKILWCLSLNPIASTSSGYWTRIPQPPPSVFKGDLGRRLWFLLSSSNWGIYMSQFLRWFACGLCFCGILLSRNFWLEGIDLHRFNLGVHVLCQS